MTFDPRYIQFIGASNSGKTTLITKLIGELCHSFDVAYLKSTHHNVTMGQKNKDTDRALCSGAIKVSIQSSGQRAIIKKGSEKLVHLLLGNHECDFTFVEGFKTEKGPKIFVCDDLPQAVEIWQKMSFERKEEIIAFVGPTEKRASFIPEQKAYFQRDQIGLIQKYILNILAVQSPLHGLVLSGGKSTRMGKDKALLKAKSGQEQIFQCVDLLKPFCEKVFVTANINQAETFAKLGLNVIEDRIHAIGPMGGLFSAQNKYPGLNFLVIPVDMPFLDTKLLSEIINKRNNLKYSTIVYNEKRSMLEPLLGIYESKSHFPLCQRIAYKDYSLKGLHESFAGNNFVKVSVRDSRKLLNMNFPEDFEGQETFISF